MDRGLMATLQRSYQLMFVSQKINAISVLHVWFRDTLQTGHIDSSLWRFDLRAIAAQNRRCLCGANIALNRTLTQNKFGKRQEITQSLTLHCFIHAPNTVHAEN